MLTELKAWLWLSRRVPLGPAWYLLEQFETPEQVYFADAGAYDLMPKLTAAHRKQLLNKSLDDIDGILGDCDSADIHILTWQDADYPERVRNIDLPPLVLYYRGKLPRFDEEIAIAMAGTRKATPYGRKVAAELAFQMTRLGGLVLTGIVEGCDEYSATAALKAGGPLVCVVAGGVDVPYYSTPSSQHLLEDVAACGCIISQQPPKTPHLGDLFALRNRLLTALAVGTVCVEAPERSGVLGVAALALDQGRDVFAVPANIDAEAAKGTNHLLSSGEAICVCSGSDVLEHYWALFPQKKKSPTTLTKQQTQHRLQASPQTEAPAQPAESSAPSPQIVDEPSLPVLDLNENLNQFTDDEITVLRALEQSDMVTDSIVIETDLPVRRVSATLTVLTIRGYVKQLPGGRFQAAVRLL